jgi:hypothetical protein
LSLGGVNIENLTINANGLTLDQAKKVVTDGINDAAKQRVQRNIGEFSTPSWFYGN